MQTTVSHSPSSTAVRSRSARQLLQGVAARAAMLGVLAVFAVGWVILGI